MVRSGRCWCLVWLAAGAHVVGAQRVPKATAVPTAPETAAPGTGCLFKQIPCPGKGPAAGFTGDIGFSSDVKDGLLCCNNDHACKYDSFGAPRCVRFDEQLCDSGAVTLKDLRGASPQDSQISVPLPLFSSVSGISNTPAPTKEFEASLTSSAPFFKTFDKAENGKFSRAYSPLVYAKCNTTETACVKKAFPGVGKAAYCVPIADADGPFCDFGFKKVVCNTDATCVRDPQDEGHCLPTKGANSVFMCTNKLKGKDGRYTICKTGSTCELSTSKVPVPLCIGKGFQLCDGGGPKPNICLNSEKCVIDKNKNGQCLKTGQFLCDAGTPKGAVAVCSADQTCVFDSASDGNCLDKGQVLCDNGFAIGTASSSSSTFNDAQDGVLYCDTNTSQNCLIQLKTNSPTCLNTAASKTACRDDNLNFGCGSGFKCNKSTGACEATQNYGVAPDQLQGAAFSAGANLAATALAALLATLALFCF